MSARMDSNDIWFMDTRVAVRVSSAEGDDGLSVLEHRAPFGDSPPMHVHRNEDEIFYVLGGTVRMRLADRDVRLNAGESALAPKGVAHTYRVESSEGAHWLTIMRGDEFERFVRAFSRAAERDGLPASSGPPSPEQVADLARTAAEHGIELVGPPLH
jgi:quercetin dioxygenase-like cupin family protein